jgi:hypothetical protein
MEKSGSVCCVVLILSIFFVVIFFIMKKRKDHKTKENYGFVMGAMGTRKSEYYNCISDCEREDPSKKLGPTHGNLFCAEYCDSKITDEILNNNKKFIVASYMDSCTAACGGDKSGNFCRDRCFCEHEVVEKCKQECAYSTSSTEYCMQECQKSKLPNCSTLAWNFK